MDDEALRTVIDSIQIEVERVEGHSPYRIIRFYEYKYVLCLWELEEYGNMRKPSYQYAISKFDVFRERREHIIVGPLERLLEAMNDITITPVLYVVRALFRMLYTVGTIAPNEYLQFLVVLKILVQEHMYQFVALMLDQFKNKMENRKHATSKTISNSRI
jgi:hypothetical protein